MQKITKSQLEDIYAVIDLCFYAMGYEDMTPKERVRKTKLSKSTLYRLRQHKTKYVRFCTIQRLLITANLTWEEVGGLNIGVGQ